MVDVLSRRRSDASGADEDGCPGVPTTKASASGDGHDSSTYDPLAARTCFSLLLVRDTVFLGGNYRRRYVHNSNPIKSSAISLSVITMSSQTTCELSVLELLHLLNEKLGLECTKLREIRICPVISASSLEPEVSTESCCNVMARSQINPSDRES